MPRAIRLAVAAALAWGAATPARGQGAQAVEAVAEPHHHLAYGDAHVRVLHVEVPAHDSTLLHAHRVDYFWVARGASDIVNAVTGKAPAHAVVPDGSVHFTRGGFTHAAFTPTGAAFHNITVELLDPQSNPRNLCDEVLAGEPVKCPPASGRYTGASVRPAFETDQLRVTSIDIAPKGTLSIAASRTPPLIIPTEAIGPGVTLACESGGETLTTRLRARAGEAFLPSAFAVCRIVNSGEKGVRVIGVDFGTQR